MLEICRNEYHDFDKKFQVYKNFRDRGYIVSPGIKFGCDFAVYQKGPGIDHAPFLVQVYNRNENMSSTDVVLAGRLATSVKKKFILAIPYGKETGGLYCIRLVESLNIFYMSCNFIVNFKKFL